MTVITRDMYPVLVLLVLPDLAAGELAGGNFIALFVERIICFGSEKLVKSDWDKGHNVAQFR